MKNKYVLLILVGQIFTLMIASEKATRKTEKFNAIKSLHEYLDDLERERLQKKSSCASGSDLPHGGKYVPVASNDMQNRRFGRGSSENNAKL